MTYNEFKKQAAVNKEVVDNFRNTEEGSKILGSISAGELGRMGIGAAFGGAGAYLLASLLNKKPSAKKRLLYTLAGMAGGGALTYAGMGVLSNDNGVSIRDMLRLSSAADKDPDFRERLDNVDPSGSSLMEGGAILSAGTGIGTVTGLRNINKHIRNTNQALAEGIPGAMDHMNRDSTWRKKYGVDPFLSNATNKAKTYVSNVTQRIGNNRVGSRVTAPVQAMWHGLKSLFETPAPYKTVKGTTRLTGTFKASRRLGGAVRGGAKGSLLALPLAVGTQLIANAVNNKSRI